MVESPSARPTWATNFISPGEAREKPTVDGMGDLSLSGYKEGLRAKVMQWSRRVVKVVIHQEGKKDQIEYLDKASVTAAYLRLAGMTGISDRDEVVNKLSEDKEVQRYALQSIGQYDSNGRKIDINMTGKTKDLTFDYVNFSDHVKEKLFHKKVFLQRTDNQVEEHFANPIAMAFQCLKRSGIEGVSDNDDRIYELALQKRVQEAAWESLENKHGSDWVQGERDVQGNVVPFKYDTKQFSQAVGDIMQGQKEEGFFTKLMHALFGRKQSETIAVKEVLTEPSELPLTEELVGPPAPAAAIVEEPKREEITQEALYEKMGPIFGDWMTLPGFKESVMEQLVKLRGTPELVDQELAGLQNGDSTFLPKHFASEAVNALDRQVVVGWIFQRKHSYVKAAETAVSERVFLSASEPTESAQIDTSKVLYNIDGKRVTEDLFKQRLGPEVLDRAHRLAGSLEDEEFKAKLTEEFESKGFKLAWGRPVIEMTLQGEQLVTKVSHRALVADKDSFGNEMHNEGAIYSGFKRAETINLASRELERQLGWFQLAGW